MQKMSLDALAREHLERAHRSEAGRSAETVYGGHEHVLSGRIRLRAGADSWDGRDGDLIIIPTARHELEARTDAVVLLTVAKSR